MLDFAPYFFKSLFLDLFKVYHIFVWLSTKTFELTTMWVCWALTLCCIVLCFVEFMLSHVYVIVKDFFENFLKHFCVLLCPFDIIYAITWLCDSQVLFFKNYDKIVIQTYVRICSAQQSRSDFTERLFY